MERTTAFANSLSVFAFLETFYPECSVDYYKANKRIEVTIHAERDKYDAEIIMNNLKPIVALDAKIESFDLKCNKSILISVSYSIK